MSPHRHILALAMITVAFLYAAEPIKERTVTFDASPKFRIEGAHTERPYASFEIEGRHVIWPESAQKYENGRTYRFEIIETLTLIPLDKGSREIWTPELLRISTGGSVIYDASICRAHKQAMARTEVPIIYGMPGGSTAYWTAFREQFPNCGILHGGCIVMPDRDTGMCWKCEKCSSMKAAWKEPNK